MEYSVYKYIMIWGYGKPFVWKKRSAGKTAADRIFLRILQSGIWIDTDLILSVIQIDAEVQMNREISGRTLHLAVPGISHIAQQIPCLHCISLLQVSIGGKMRIIKVSAARSVDSDTPSPQLQPTHTSDRSVCHTDHGIEFTFIFRGHDIRPFMPSAPSIISVIHPGIHKRNGKIFPV